MSDIINLSCPSCGGKLQFTNDIERFACGYCGNELIVKRSGGIVSLTPVVNAIKDVQIGVDRTASELAIARLTNDINEVSAKINEIDYQTSSKKLRYRLLLILGIIMLPISFPLMAGPGDKSFGLMLLLISLILFYAAYQYNVEFNENNMLIDDLLEKYKDIKDELEGHKQIVSQKKVHLS